MQFLKSIFHAAMLVSCAGFVSAQTVKLESLDGIISIIGELVDYNNDFYIIRTNIGDMNIASAQVSCIGENCPEIIPAFTAFSISGAKSLGKTLLPDLLDGFGRSLDYDVTHSFDENGNPKVVFSNDTGNDVAEISFSLKGSTNGLNDLLIGEASLAITTRAIRPTEATAIANAGLGDTGISGFENILALDGLVIVVSAANRIQIIGEAEIAKIFSGEISNWAQLGGDDAIINLYVRPENTGTGSIFSQLIMQPARLQISRNVTELDTDVAIADAVAIDPYGIGFTTFSNERSARAMSLRGSCGIQSPATNFTIKTEEYPFSRRMYFYRPTNNLPLLAEKFFEYLNTNEAQKVVTFSGFVGQAATEEVVNNQGLRFLAAMLPINDETTLPNLQNMVTELATARRLTITYRFGEGTSQLDSRAQGDIVRLAQRIEAGGVTGSEIMLIGFSDSVGLSDINDNLSLIRAEQVRDSLIAELTPGSFDPAKIRVLGFGELSPLGCNDTLIGRQINRRVEVWTR